MFLKLKKEKVGKVVEKCKCLTSQNKILKDIGFSKSSYYYKNKNKSISEFDLHIGDQIELIWKENRCKIDRWNIFFLLNEMRKKNNELFISERIVRRIMKQRDIGARLTFKSDKTPTENKNSKFRCYDKIKRGWKSCKPFTKLFTDVTLLKTPWGFVYISSIIDGYNNAVIA
ncbi:MAG: hypothetical protein LBV48_00560 [Mycoplasmataceae bacterium]|nr:hypothetical protein [Mycoplasmataceae bacterium]